MKHPLTHRILFLLLWFWVGCSSTTEECDQETPCSTGESCVQGTCITVECSTSSQCPMEHYCNQQECTSGCESDSDCYFGDACEEGVCMLQACESTHLDCGFKEFCDQPSGECYDAGGSYCRPCSSSNDEADCGEGNYCYQGYCAVQTETLECPSGFSILTRVDRQGNVYGYYCTSNCELYQ